MTEGARVLVGKLSDGSFGLERWSQAGVREIPVWGTGTNVKDYGAVGNGATDDSTAFANAIAGSIVTRGAAAFVQQIYVPSGLHLVGAASLVPKTGQLIRGDGSSSSLLKLKTGANVPILDVSATSAYLTLRDLRFDATGTTGHTTGYPLLKLTAIYLSLLDNIFVIDAPDDGIWFGGAGTISDGIRLTNSIIAVCAGHGIHFRPYGGTGHQTASAGFSIWGCAIESCTKSCVYVQGDSGVPYQQGLIIGSRFEGQAGEHILRLERATGISVRSNYFNGGIAVHLDENSHGNVIDGNQLLSGAQIHDGGYLNTIRDNDGVFNPCTRAKEFHYPSSRLADGDMNLPYVLGGGASRGGTAGTIDKQLPGSLFEPTGGGGIDMHAGKGSPIRILPAAGNASGYSYTQTLTVVAGETYLFEAYWAGYAVSSAAASFLMQLTDAAGTTVYWDSTGLTKPWSVTYSNFRVARGSAVVQIPAGVTSVVVRLSAITANAVYLDRLDMIRLPLSNGGFDGTYVSGIAPGWSQSQIGGAPVKTSEATRIRPAMIGAAIPTGTVAPRSQKIGTAVGESYELSQGVTVDHGRPYFLRGFVYVDAGDPKQAYIAWGAGGFDGQYYRFRTGPRKAGSWEAVTRFFRPGESFNSVLVGVKTGQACTALFDDLALIPLKEVVAEKVLVSAEINLSASATFTQMIIGPSIDSVLRRVTAVYTEASDANAGVALRIGTYADATFFGSYTSEVSQALGSQREATLSHTSIRAGTPVVITGIANKVGTGKVRFSLEYE